MESLVAIVIVALGCVIALLIAAVLELKALRVSIDACRQMVGDAVGSPQVDLIDVRTKEGGTVDIPRAYRELVANDDEREELEAP